MESTRHTISAQVKSTSDIAAHTLITKAIILRHQYYDSVVVVINPIPFKGERPGFTL
jgi:hypothetical protein